MIFFLDVFQFFDDSMQQLLHTENIYCLYFWDLLLLFYLISMQEILSMIFLFLGLFYGYDRPINQHFQIQNYFHFLIFSHHPDNYLKKLNKLIINIICFITRSNFFIITPHKKSVNFSCIIRRDKIHAHINWIFHSLFLIFLWSFIKSAKCGMIM